MTQDTGHKKTKTKKKRTYFFFWLFHASCDLVSLCPHMVGKGGFEPPTSSSRTMRASQLRYFPLNITKSSISKRHASLSQRLIRQSCWRKLRYFPLNITKSSISKKYATLCPIHTNTKSGKVLCPSPKKFCESFLKPDKNEVNNNENRGIVASRIFEVKTRKKAVTPDKTIIRQDKQSLTSFFTIIITLRKQDQKLPKINWFRNSRILFRSNINLLYFKVCVRNKP